MLTPTIVFIISLLIGYKLGKFRQFRKRYQKEKLQFRRRQNAR